MDIKTILSQIVLPLLFYGFATYFALYTAVQAIKALRGFKRDGVIVGAEVEDLSEKLRTRCGFTEKVYYVTLICTPPNSDEPIRYILSTNHRKGKRYAKLKHTEVCFLSKEDNAPVLFEELRTAKRVRSTALFGGIICLLFLLLLLLAVTDHFADGRITHFLHELFFD